LSATTADRRATSPATAQKASENATLNAGTATSRATSPVLALREEKEREQTTWIATTAIRSAISQGTAPVKPFLFRRQARMIDIYL